MLLGSVALTWQHLIVYGLFVGYTTSRNKDDLAPALVLGLIVSLTVVEGWQWVAAHIF